MLRRIVVILFIAAAGMSLLAGCGSKKVDAKDSVNLKNVKVVAAQRTDITIESEFGGEVKAGEEAGVVPKVPGRVKEISVKVGDVVKEGDVLFTLDAEDVKAQLAQAEAGVDVARANLEKTRNSGLSQSRIQAQMEFDQARVSYEDVDSEYTRSKALFDKNSISRKEMDAVATRLELARQRYETARKNLELVEKGSGPEAIKIAESQLNQAMASVQLVKTQLENLSVRAPIPGIITAKNIHTGEAASSAAPAVTIVNSTELNAEISIPERLINKLSGGQNLTVTVQSLGNRVFNGKVSMISPAMDAATKNYKVKVTILNKTDEVRPGMFAKIKLATDGSKDTIAVPNQALVTESGVYYVYTVKEGEIEKTPVKIGLSNDQVTEIIQGLPEGGNVITEGQSFLAAGEKVNIVK